nr:GTP-binding nuclear protein Ran-like [Drosophila takahashii]
MKVYKLVLLGDAAVGKTAFIGRLLDGSYPEKYEPTVGVDLTPLTFRTNRGDIHFMVWDIAGQEMLAGLGDGYCIQADCAIIMFGLNSRKSFAICEKWHRDLMRICSQIPVVICKNRDMVIMDDRRMRNNQSFFGRKLNLVNYEISVKLNFNLEKPFLYLARKLLNDPKLNLIQNPGPPKEIKVEGDLTPAMEL